MATEKRTRIVMGDEERSVVPDQASQEKSESHERMHKMKNKVRASKELVFMRWVIAVVLLAMLALDGVVLSRFVINNTLETSFYHASSDKVSDTIRIVQLTDLHDQQFGENNEALIGRIAELKPDIVLMTGDMVSENYTVSFENITHLCKELVKIAPTYVVAGNHEAGIQFSEPDVDWSIGNLKETGVHVVSRSVEKLQIGEDQVLIGGFYRMEKAFDSDKVLKGYMESFNEMEPDALKLLLIHEPNMYVNKLTGYDKIDFVFSGHAHGGHVRLPIIGGLYAPDQGLFPKYTCGMSEFGSTRLLISRGLGNESRIPRFNNHPELLVLDIER